MHNLREIILWIATAMFVKIPESGRIRIVPYIHAKRYLDTRALLLVSGQKETRKKILDGLQ